MEYWSDGVLIIHFSSTPTLQYSNIPSANNSAEAVVYCHPIKHDFFT